MKFLIMFIDELISKGHRYRKFIEIIDFDVINLRLRSLKSDNPNEGYGLFRIFKCLFLQFLEDLSDRELETFGNVANYDEQQGYEKTFLINIDYL